MQAIRRVVLCLGLFTATSSFSQVPNLINYQGKLLNGTNLVNASTTMVFRLYGSASGPDMVFVETQSLTVVDGLYATRIGFLPDYGTLADAITNQPLFLEVQVGSAVLSPRERVVAVAYALVAQSVEEGAITTDMLADNAVTGVKIYNGAVHTIDLADDAVTSDKIATNAVGNSEMASGAVDTDEIMDGSVTRYKLQDTYWQIDGNPSTTDRVHFVGTTDTQPLNFKVNNTRALRLVPTATSPSLIGGSQANTNAGGAIGVTIAGGGSVANPQTVGGDYATIGGGLGNTADGAVSVVDGGYENAIDSDANYSAIGGGGSNAVGANSTYATVAGGSQNQIGDNATHSVIGGGKENLIEAIANDATIAGGYNGEIAEDSDFAVIGGGDSNYASNNYTTIGGGWLNVADGYGSTVAGGRRNNANGDYAFAGGGRNNRASGLGAAVVGGFSNVVTGDSAFIGGGNSNVAGGSFSTVAGGQNNTASKTWATIGGGGGNEAGSLATVAGGSGNIATGACSVIGGGTINVASRRNATVSGGENNRANAEDATVSGGKSNTASGTGATIGGGEKNLVNSDHATVGGGYGNVASGIGATVAGGGGFDELYEVWMTNYARSRFSTVGGGAGNTAHSDFATVGGGEFNTAYQQYSTVSGGFSNYVGGPCATIPGGALNNADGYYSFAAGYRAKATHFGSFVLADGQQADCASAADNEMTIRMSNGVRFVSNADAKSVDVGERFRDNAVIAWGRVIASGAISSNSFGVSSVVHTNTGSYEITLTAHTATTNGATLIPTATAVYDATLVPPVGVYTVRYLQVAIMNDHQFRVYIQDGSWDLIDEDFVFMCTGR